jgi:hypothetical protein
LIVLVLLLEIHDDRALWIARYLCSYLVAAFVVISGFHYSIVVSRRLHFHG